MANLRCTGGPAPSSARISNSVAEPPLPAIIPAVERTVSEPAMYNDTSTADTQLRNLDREFRAGRISVEEYRQMKKVLTGE